MNWVCYECHKVALRPDDATEKKCFACGSTKGEFISHDRLKEGFDSGVYFNLDPRTGKRAKTKRR